MTPRQLLEPARLAGRPLLRAQTDERLVDLVRSGNERAFEAIVDRYRRPLLRYCGRLLPEGRAEDAVQQTFVSAYDALRSSDAPMALRPWLYRIAHNVSLNALRQKGWSYEELSLEHDGVERPDQALERKESLRSVLASVEALPERQRDAILLRELEGRSYPEIAEALEVTGGSVRQLLNRARTTVRAAATAITPVGLLRDLPSQAEGAGQPMAARIAEITAGGGIAATAAKAGTALLVSGAVVAGAGDGPGPAGAERGGEASAGERRATLAGSRESGSGDVPSARGGSEAGRARGEGRRGRSSRPASDDRSGPSRGRHRRGRDHERDGELLELDDRSGPGGGDGDGGSDDHFSRSGPGSGGGFDSSGPGSGDFSDSGGGFDSSGSGSGGFGDSGGDSSGSGSGGDFDSSGPGGG